MKRAATTALVVGVAVLLGMLGVMQVAAQDVSVTRSFVGTGSVTAGGELEVRIDISGGYGGIGKVVETLPDGFSYVTGTSALVLDDITVDDDGREMVPFSLVGEDTFTYRVDVSSDAMPPHTFSGVLTYGIDKDTVNIGASSVTVEQPSTPTGVSVTRSFDTGSVAADEEVGVTINISGGYGGIGKVLETLPAGFSYVSGSSPLVLEDIAEDDNGRQMVPFSLVGETDFKYKVLASSEATPPHTFSGVFTYGIDRSEGDNQDVRFRRNGGAADHTHRRQCDEVLRHQECGC